MRKVFKHMSVLCALILCLFYLTNSAYLFQYLVVLNSTKEFTHVISGNIGDKSLDNIRNNIVSGFLELGPSYMKKEINTAQVNSLSIFENSETIKYSWYGNSIRMKDSGPRDIVSIDKLTATRLKVKSGDDIKLYFGDKYYSFKINNIMQTNKYTEGKLVVTKDKSTEQILNDLGLKYSYSTIFVSVENSEKIKANEEQVIVYPIKQLRAPVHKILIFIITNIYLNIIFSSSIFLMILSKYVSHEEINYVAPIIVAFIGNYIMLKIVSVPLSLISQLFFAIFIYLIIKIPWRNLLYLKYIVANHKHPNIVNPG